MIRTARSDTTLLPPRTTRLHPRAALVAALLVPLAPARAQTAEDAFRPLPPQLATLAGDPAWRDWRASPPALAPGRGSFSDEDSNGEAREGEEETEDAEESPWLIVPLFSLNPKLGFSVGVLPAYLHYFDEKSRVSTFGVSATYTSTDSYIANAFAKTSYGEDHHRLLLMLASGRVRNDYDDFLGTGVPLRTSDELRAFASRYLYRVFGDWFGGVQAIYTNYDVAGETALDDANLQLLGLQKFSSGGAGVSIYHDSRDNENMPTQGWFLNANNVAYREWIAGTESYDVYRVDYRGFTGHGEGHVLVVRQFNQFTADAPPGAYAPIQLRGYKVGQYRSKNMSSLEAEERLHLAERFTATLFAGTAVQYGSGESLSDGKSWFPNWGGGLQFVIKQKEGIVLNLEYAGGKNRNYGIYMKLGYAF